MNGKNKIPIEVIQSANRFPILALCNEFGLSLKSYGQKFLCNCPLPEHEDSTPSFYVYPEKNWFRCYGCHYKPGDNIELVMRLKMLTFADAVKYLVNHPPIDPNFKIQFNQQKPSLSIERTREMMSTQFNLYKPVYGDALDYLKKRGMSQESLNIFQVRYHHDSNFIANSLKKLFSKEELIASGLFTNINLNDGRPFLSYCYYKFPILFPSFRCGQLVSLRGRYLEDGNRAVGNTRRWKTCFHPMPFNMDTVASSLASQVVHITEGPTDLVSLKEIALCRFLNQSGIDKRFIPQPDSPMIGITSVNHIDRIVFEELVNRTVCFWTDAGALELKLFESFREKAEKQFGMKVFNARTLNLLAASFKDVNEYLIELKSKGVK